MAARDHQDDKLPIPSLSTTAYTTKTVKKRRKTLESQAELKKDRDKARNKTRVNIGAAFPRWRELKELKGMKFDSELAFFLLDRYSASRQNKTVLSPHHDHDTKGELCNETSLLTEGVLDREKDMCPPAELVIPVGLDSSEESQGSGVDEEEDEEETAVENRNEIEEEEETGTKQDECDMDEEDEECDSSSRQSKNVVSPHHDHDTEGELCNETSLLTEEVLDREEDMCPPAELEIPVGLDSSEESQGSGVDEEEEEEETAVENRNEIEEEEETGTEKYEGDMDEEDYFDMDENDDEWEMDEEGDTESECEVNVGKKVRKRVRDNDNPDQPLRKRYNRQRRPETLCTNCGILYTTMKHTCLPNEKFRCSSCGCVFENEMNLSIHRKNCSRSIHPCTFCFKPFKTRQEKHNHETSHSEIQPYQCTECPQTFSDRLTRNRHLREHQKRVRCETCHKEFRAHYMLARHELSHSKDKPYKCQVCDRVFAQASQLKSHTRVHTGEKPFQCQLCPKTFNHNVSLKNHIQRYHQEESRDDPSSALKERRESNKYHSLDNQLENRTEQERDGGLDMKVSRSLNPKELTFWADLDVPQGGSDGEGGEGGEGGDGHKRKRTRRKCLPTRHEELEEDSEEMVNDDSDFDPDEESVPSKRTRKGRGRGKLR